MSLCGWVGKPRARRDAVVVDHPQRAEAHVLGVVIVAERKGVAAVEPAEIGPSALFGFAMMEHGLSPECVGAFGFMRGAGVLPITKLLA